MKNKKNIIIIIFIIIALALIIGGLYLTKENSPDEPSSNEENVLFYDFPEDQRLTITNCKTTDTCMIPETDSYNTLVIDSKYKVLNEKVEKINEDTKNYYNQVNSSTTDNEKCINVKDLYYHELRVKTNYYNYENDKYISIAVQRDIINLCDDIYQRKQVEWYLYDKEEDKLLTQEEFKEKELINTQEIDIAIKKIINIVNEEEGLSIDVSQHSDDIIVFYDFEGNIILSLYIPEVDLYYTGTVRINTTN